VPKKAQEEQVCKEKNEEEVQGDLWPLLGASSLNPFPLPGVSVGAVHGRWCASGGAQAAPGGPQMRRRFGDDVRALGANFTWTPENWQKSQVAVQGVYLHSDKGLQGHFVPTRPNEMVGYNHQQDCFHLSRGLRSAIGLVEFISLDRMSATQTFYEPVFKAIKAFLQSALPHKANMVHGILATQSFCKPLLFGNPTNAPRSD
jgi:hypothetical protein